MFSLTGKFEDLDINVDELDVATRDAMRRGIAGLASAARAEWIRLANSRLKTSRADYILGLQKPESFQTVIVDGEPAYILTLIGEMANNFEFGMPRFDMKAVDPGWLKGRKSKVGKDGKRYVVIPFRHSTSSNTNLGYSGKAAAQDMRSKLKLAMSKGVAIPTGEATSMNKMQRTSTGEVQRGKVAKIPSKADVHNYLQGMVRIQEATAGQTAGGKQKGTGQLLTWRIMSENSKPSAWIHPGIKGANLLPEVERFVDREMANIIATVMGAA